MESTKPIALRLKNRSSDDTVHIPPNKIFPFGIRVWELEYLYVEEVKLTGNRPRMITFGSTYILKTETKNYVGLLWYNRNIEDLWSGYLGS